MANRLMPEAIHPHHDFSTALQCARKRLGVTQEAFDLVSSRTYVSAVERGLKVPTLSKIDEFAGVLGIHPLTLLVTAYVRDARASGARELLRQVECELLMLDQTANPA